MFSLLFYKKNYFKKIDVLVTFTCGDGKQLIYRYGTLFSVLYEKCSDYIHVWKDDVSNCVNPHHRILGRKVGSLLKLHRSQRLNYAIIYKKFYNT